MRGVLLGFPFLKALTPERHVDTHGGCIAVHFGGVLQYFLGKLYGLGVPKHCPVSARQMSGKVSLAAIFASRRLGSCFQPFETPNRRISTPIRGSP